jgi:hypothetical protein
MYYRKIIAKNLLVRELYIRFASEVTIGNYRSRFIVGEYFYEKYISKYTVWKKLPTNNYLDYSHVLFIIHINTTLRHWEASKVHTHAHRKVAAL